MPFAATELEEARAYEAREEGAIPAGDRPRFHLTPRVGWMNDPNGFCFYQVNTICFTSTIPTTPSGDPCTGATPPAPIC